jgi:hypothetical protein
MKWWDDLPEALRWVLFLPALFALTILCVLPVWIVQLLLELVGLGLGHFAFGFAVASTSAWFGYALVFALPPRGKRFLGWIFYVPMVLWCVITLLLMLGQQLGRWGLLGSIQPPAWDEGWTGMNTQELGGALAWLFVGTSAFRAGMEKHPAPRKS